MEPPSKKPKPSSDPNPAGGGRVFPRKLIFNILSRLPVKSIIRFGNVSDHWRTLTTQEEFKSAHLSRSPSSILIQTQNYPETIDDHALYTCSPPNQPSVTGFPEELDIDIEGLDIIGSTQNGIVCLSLTRGGERIALWNPATRSTITIPSPTISYNPGIHGAFSVGVGYDPTQNGIVIVHTLCQSVEKDPDEAQIYSLSQGRWQTVEFGDASRFHVYRRKCDAVVNGVPYWASKHIGTGGTVMVSFNPTNMSFDVEPFEDTLALICTMCYGEIMGCLAVVAWEEEDGDVVENQFLDIWIRDNQTRLWNKLSRVHNLYFLGVVVGTYGERGIVQEIEDGEGVLFYAFDFESPPTGKELEFPKPMVPGICEVVRYKESLYSIQ